MKYIKLFENFSEGDWKENIFKNAEIILDIIYELRDYSLEYLDPKNGVSFIPERDYPSTGGSGTDGKIMKGDIWYITGLNEDGIVTIGPDEIQVENNDKLTALIDEPGQKTSNWSVTSSSKRTLIFNIMIEDKKGNLDSIFDGYFDSSIGLDKPIEDYFNWNEPFIPKDLMEIPDLIKSYELKLMINFAIITGAEEGNPELTDDSGKLYQKIIVAYPDVEFDIIDPWDLY